MRHEESSGEDMRGLRRRIEKFLCLRLSCSFSRPYRVYFINENTPAAQAEYLLLVREKVRGVRTWRKTSHKAKCSKANTNQAFSLHTLEIIPVMFICCYLFLTPSRKQLNISKTEQTAPKTRPTRTRRRSSSRKRLTSVWTELLLWSRKKWTRGERPWESNVWKFGEIRYGLMEPNEELLIKNF